MTDEASFKKIYDFISIICPTSTIKQTVTSQFNQKLTQLNKETFGYFDYESTSKQPEVLMCWRLFEILQQQHLALFFPFDDRELCLDQLDLMAKKYQFSLRFEANHDTDFLYHLELMNLLKQLNQHLKNYGLSLLMWQNESDITAILPIALDNQQSIKQLFEQLQLQLVFLK